MRRATTRARPLAAPVRAANHRTAETPTLTLDLEQIRRNHDLLRTAFPSTWLYYAVKANPAPGILATLATAGCRFDIASIGEAFAALAAGADPAHLSYTTPIKKFADIKAAHELGVPWFTADSADEVDKVAVAAPGATLFVRIAVGNDGAAAPFGEKFGCDPRHAADLLRRATHAGLSPAGVSWHVGSQQLDVHAWDKPMGVALLQ
ncbi:hypothetical protein GCM10009733_021760 [Nonomuraea maheshkhaliensis]|uniref:ornithine decarboxylase n=1 Tax=Nonomuraea maheshkhaliensis TaxID=419590 RepID=A0ABP4QVF8_9ACTN